jgi:drug/metabolite transporter (DMT)-like permease
MIGMNVAVSTVGSTITSFVAGLYAITAALFAPVVLGERLERRAVVGFVVALAGTALLAELGPSPSALVGLVAGGVAAVSFGFYLVLIRRWSRAIDIGPLGISLTTAGVSAVGLAIGLAILQPRSMVPSNLSPEVVVATAWLVLVTVSGPIFATIALRRIEAALASSLLLINPITATILSAILLAERPSAAQLLGGMLVLVGMATATDLVGALRRRRARAARAEA